MKPRSTVEIISKAIKDYKMVQSNLKVPVNIDHGEVLKLVVRDLIAKRNHPSCSIRKEIDCVLKTYYLEEDEFNEYVLNHHKPIS